MIVYVSRKDRLVFTLEKYMVIRKRDERMESDA